MITLIKLTLNAIFGLIVHSLLNDPIESLEDGQFPVGSGWVRMLRYSIGYGCCFVAFWTLLPEERRDSESMAAFLGGGVSFAAGVAFGYFFEESTLVDLVGSSLKK